MPDNLDNTNQSQNSRVYFDADRKTDWQEDARDLIQAVIFNFDHDEPESLVKVLTILDGMVTEAATRDALYLLIEACYENLLAHSQALTDFIEACRTKPTKWDLAKENPRQVQAEANEDTQAERGVADPNRPHWIPRLCEALAEAFQDESLSDQAHNHLADATTEIIREYASNIVTETNTLLPAALARAAGKEPPPSLRNRKPNGHEAEGAEELREYLNKKISPDECDRLEGALLSALGSDALPPGLYEIL
jgi:hypothetical protein